MRGVTIFGLIWFVVFLSPTGAQSASINLVGAEQTVYDYDSMHCFPFDQPDIPARAFRDHLGRVQLTLASANTRMIGPNLDNLAHDCTVVTPHLQRPLASDYADEDWMSGLYTTDGQEVFALLHAEYHGHEHPGYCGEVFTSCRYNTVTSARSTNGGDLYVRPPPPSHLVAAMPYRYVPGDGRYGFFAPSNIFEKDGWYYNFVLVSVSYREQRSGVCLMRTQTLADPKSWRAWDGAGFNVRFIDPYRESGEPTAAHVCEPIRELGQLNRSITYNTFLGQYVVIGTTTKYEPSVSRFVSGFYYSFSSDLFHWTPKKLLIETPPATCGGPPRVGTYPSFLDPDSTDRNFNTSNQRLYLYYVRSQFENCIQTQERDMFRREIEIVP